MARGLMVYPMGGTIDGQRGDHVLLAPPFIVSASQIDEIVDRLGSAVDDASGLSHRLRAGGNNEPASPFWAVDRVRSVASRRPPPPRPGPARPVSMIVPASAGGPTDAIARVLSRADERAARPDRA